MGWVEYGTVTVCYSGARAHRDTHLPDHDLMMRDMREPPSTTDALELEIFRYSVMSICEEIEINITRTAYSYLIRETKDYVVGLLTDDFRVFAQSAGSIPIFVAGLGEPVADAVELIGAERLRPGDVFITNFTDVTGQHANNAIVASPIFDASGIVGYVAIKSHWADVGGLKPGGQSYASRSIFHEGTRYRGLRVMREGEVVPEVLATIRANTWQPEVVTGDLMAQVAGCLLAGRRWEERVTHRWNADESRQTIAASLAASAETARQLVRALPDGEYESRTSWVFEEGGQSLDLQLELKMQILGDRISVDLSLPPEVELPINSGTVGGAVSAMRLAFRLVVTTDAPLDDGFFDVLEVRVPDGTIASASANAPLGHWNTMMPVLIELFIQAIGSKHPELVPASHFAAMGAVILSGELPDGRTWWHADGAAGGLGADASGDGFGPVKVLMSGDSPTVPLELIEAHYPLRIHYHRVDRSAGGSGKHQGGPATERVTEALAELSYDHMPEPTTPPQGLAGGQPGRPGGLEIKLPGTADWLDPDRDDSVAKTLPTGSLIRHRSGGGGGWGIPDGTRTR
jgi:N-methylhydantoinase B